MKSSPELSETLKGIALWGLIIGVLLALSLPGQRISETPPQGSLNIGVLLSIIPLALAVSFALNLPLLGIYVGVTESGATEWRLVTLVEALIAGLGIANHYFSGHGTLYAGAGTFSIYIGLFILAVHSLRFLRDRGGRIAGLCEIALIALGYLATRSF